MIIDSKGRQLKITLTATEICDYFGSFKEIRYDNARSRAALGSILLRAMENSDFSLSADRLSIKVYPTHSGGCDIYFILGGGRRLLRSDYPYIYEFENCEDMLSFCEQIKRIKDDMLLSIYRNEGLYRIIIDSRDMSRRLLKLGTEFAVSIIHKRFSLAKTKEHWHKICGNTPVKQIII